MAKKQNDTNNKNSASVMRIFLMASVVFIVFFVFLFFVFALAAKFSEPRKQLKPMVASDSIYKTNVPNVSNNTDDLGYNFVDSSATPNPNSAPSSTSQTLTNEDAKPALVSH